MADKNITIQHMAEDGTIEALYPATTSEQVQGLDDTLEALETSVDTKTAALEAAVDSKVTDLEDYVNIQVSTIKSRKYATCIIGTELSGHTAGDVDILCTGTDDQVKINAAIQSLSGSGGKILLREGDFNLTGGILMNRENVTLEGMGFSTRLLSHMRSSDDNADNIIKLSADYCTIQNLYAARADGFYDYNGYSIIRAISGYNNRICNNHFRNFDGGIDIIEHETGGIISNNIFDNTFNPEGWGYPVTVNDEAVSNWLIIGNISLAREVTNSPHEFGNADFSPQ